MSRTRHGTHRTQEDGPPGHAPPPGVIACPRRGGGATQPMPDGVSQSVNGAENSVIFELLQSDTRFFANYVDDLQSNQLLEMAILIV